ncbi:glycosyltransferase family 2 protein [Paraglaciecola psychrophila]|uniref:Glycosyltransferase 2-like domain-containing protein n=1 Tax=Paraglaciecola psychrophila 170 TaxID=1129794 RepID=K7A525_9ALTE|nr:hypothetical protein [Paraglaciecola psychrophila]AGH43747.1 hypothetical protein C427_1638 [Paraglaciecola psychrophila 170]GAC35953.1 hypothetical protein GPSY_0311 [Paraglaciecola psychrophila 170]
MEKTQAPPHTKLTILVVLYNIEILESETVKSLILTSLGIQSVKLLIWNNGPDYLKVSDVEPLKKVGFDAEVIETIGNESLAVIYNHFIHRYSSENYLILDHDTVLNDIYLAETLSSKSSELSVPTIRMNGNIEGPYLNKSIIKFPQRLSTSDHIMAIGSGLVIGREIVQEIKASYSSVFDERFYLYGVDSTFFHRVNKLKLGNRVKVISGFEHFLSRLESEPEKLKAFRRKERAYDSGLQFKYYYSFLRSYYLFSRLLLDCIINKVLGRSQSINYLDLMAAFYNGVHYRKDH